MNWSEFIAHVVHETVSTKDGVKTPGLSDIIIRDIGPVVYASVLGSLELIPVPPSLRTPDSFDMLLANFVDKKDAAGRMVWEGAWMVQDLRFRLSLSFYMHGRELVMRLLPSRIPTPEEALIPPVVLETFMRMDYGLVLILGSTGSGKSTTAASLMQHMGAKTRKRFITIEDPIEFVFPGNLLSTFTQRQVGQHCSSFSQALIAALRQLPNVIMVGEIRDPDTAEVAVQAAESGHLVVSTMHVETPDQAVQRLLNLIPPERLAAFRDTLARVFRMGVAQRLVRHPTEKHRVPIHEVLLGDVGVASLIRRGDYHMLNQHMETNKNVGMQTFAQAEEDRRTQGLL